tara:strand:- start:231 stop:854 length:624 start_codon:yes stop_codon:yes gene_type:complete
LILEIGKLNEKTMDSFKKHTGSVTPLYQINIDTDQIIPKQFLKRIERTGFGEFLFNDWRFDSEGKPIKDFILNNPKYKKSSILATGKNFGSGSSREHAAWALHDYGFKCILAPSFADIFYNNCFKIGLLPIQINEHQMEKIVVCSEKDPNYQLTIDLDCQTITENKSGEKILFEIDPFMKNCLINGLDEIGLTLQHREKIRKFEESR